MATTKTKSEIFTLAHKIARETKDQNGGYRMAFRCAMIAIYNGDYDEKPKKQCKNSKQTKRYFPSLDDFDSETILIKNWKNSKKRNVRVWII